ncbi:maleylpyruvate isomerase family mycothiol-dependent enzyme [Gordonia soli]|uniref:Mycothiol-dependent maleylpyruvate isomerase metal-binding domain-containing protein n=1 Tax=Gordonia soli NBRC 108243 TaxID=1223545 RepID=M0QLL9_9ACTN|nr:maleylpyruvate isomerase family mycothiol-dependent enzyme [Gordonia soli]GAC69448.1 hypothetical protein GS4_25_00180 [Gordonia soli NBRC 108243]
MSGTIVPRAEIVDELSTQWAAIAEFTAALTDTQWAQPSILPGWSVADVVAHVIGTESMLEGREVTAGRDVAALDHVHNAIGEFNENWLDHFRTRPRDEVAAAYREIVETRSAALAAMSQEDFDAETVTPAGRDTYGRFMRIRVFDCWMHEIDIRDTIDSPPPVEPTTAARALDEIAASLPFVIGKRAGAPDGSRVLVDVTGVGGRRLHVAVDGRAAMVDDFGGVEPDVTLRLDIIDLARLIGGRATADPSRVEITGDRALGEQIVRVLAYTI